MFNFNAPSTTPAATGFGSGFGASSQPSAQTSFFGSGFGTTTPATGTASNEKQTTHHLKCSSVYSQNVACRLIDWFDVGIVEHVTLIDWLIDRLIDWFKRHLVSLYRGLRNAARRNAAADWAFLGFRHCNTTGAGRTTEFFQRLRSATTSQSIRHDQSLWHGTTGSATTANPAIRGSSTRSGQSDRGSRLRHAAGCMRAESLPLRRWPGSGAGQVQLRPGHDGMRKSVLCTQSTAPADESGKCVLQVEGIHSIDWLIDRLSDQLLVRSFDWLIDRLSDQLLLRSFDWLIDWSLHLQL